MNSLCGFCKGWLPCASFNSLGEDNMNWKYQLVLQFPCSTQTDYDSMIAIEGQLIAELGNRALVDGHDAGSGEMNIFIHTNDPKRIFDGLRMSRSSDPMFFQMRAAFRDLKSNKFTVLWPKGFKGRFAIT